MSLPTTPQGSLPEAQRPTHDQIAARAFRIYVEHGCDDGHDLEHWLEAEQALIQEVAVPLAAQAPVLALEQISKSDAHAAEPSQPQFARDGRGSVSGKENRKQPSPTSATRQSVRPEERGHRQRLQDAA